MSRWWYRTPIIFVCVSVVAIAFFVGKVAYAASGDPEFALILQAGATSFTDYLAWLLDVLELTW